MHRIYNCHVLGWVVDHTQSRGLTRTAISVAPGTNSCSNPNRFDSSWVAKNVIPVRLPPRPLLLIGFALEPVRGLLLATTAAYPALMLAQVLSGVTGAVIGVLTVIVVADLTAGTGRFNLAIGVLRACELRKASSPVSIDVIWRSEKESPAVCRLNRRGFDRPD